MYRYAGQESFRDVLRRVPYEDSRSFADQMMKDILNVVNLASLSEKFETEGAVDPDKTVCSFTDEEGNEQSYTLQNVLDYGRSIGIVLDSEHRLVIQQGPVTAQEGEDAAAVGLPGEMDEGTVLLSTLYQLEEYYSLKKYLRVNSKPGNFHYRFVLAYDGGLITSVNDSRLTMESLNSYGKFYSLDNKKDLTVSNLKARYQDRIRESLSEYAPLKEGIYEILAAVNTDYKEPDIYTREAFEYQRITRLLRLISWMGAAMLVGMLVTFGVIAVMGWKEIHSIDSWYMELMLFGEGLCGLVILWSFSECRYAFSARSFIDLVTGAILALIAYVPMMGGCLSIFRRICHRKFLEGFLVCRAIRGIREGLENANDRWKSGTRILSLLAYQVVSVLLAMGTGITFYFHHWILMAIFAFFLLLVQVWYLVSTARGTGQLKTILLRIADLADGKVGEKLDPSTMDGEMKRIAMTVNSLDDSLELAVQERTRSERMKTDLIANVSHDLRTPLTSIISYVDLIRRENIPNPKVQEYLRVLDEKANRMVTMAEALMDASRATSGNLKIRWERIDLVQMLQQVHGEFQERMEEKQLVPILRMVDPPAVILADGKILWRVLDNLYTNVCKYAKPGTQVLIELQETAHSLIYTMKNVSAMPLKLSADELMERFIRGDSARTTEGSGLGLSIARSMTEQLHGKFELFPDGEVFRVRLVFSKVDV